jgi:hypothetical protein
MEDYCIIVDEIYVLCTGGLLHNCVLQICSVYWRIAAQLWTIDMCCLLEELHNWGLQIRKMPARCLSWRRLIAGARGHHLIALLKLN